MTSTILKYGVCKSLKLLDDPIDGLLVKLQIAVLCNVGEVITRDTWALERGSPMVEKVGIFLLVLGPRLPVRRCCRAWGCSLNCGDTVDARMTVSLK